MFLLAATAAWIDVKRLIIPNWLNLSGAVVGLVIGVVFGDFLFHLYGLLWGLGLGFLMYLMKAVSEGDGKLFAAIGALSGSTVAVAVLFLSMMLFVLIWAPIRIRREGVRGFFRSETAGLVMWLSRVPFENQKGSSAFAPFVLGGVILVFLVTIIILKGGILL